MKSDFFSLIWRLAILALPWQTRWFAEASLAGWPWEQGRLSFYISWFFILATIFLAQKINPPKFLLWEKFQRFFIPLVLLFISTLMGTRLEAGALRAVLQWWLQVALLSLFVWSLVRSGVSAKQVAAWFVVSLLPHAGLGIWQFMSQQVVGSAGLGIAAQNPQNLGVSVVEASGFRILRSYGGFPHPNIFGGWLAVGYLAAVWLAGSAKNLRRTLTWSICTAAFAVALIFSFSRTAWLAAIIGAAVFLFLIIRRKFSYGRKSAFWKGVLVALLVSVIASSAVVIPMRKLIFLRFNQTSRLEVKSVQERTIGLQTGIDILRRNLFFGTGPNAELLDLAKRLPQGTSDAPLEPPHSAYLLALVNLGLIGTLLVLAVFLPFLFKLSAISYQLLAALAVLALFDYYLWSYWSGQALAAIGFLLVFLENEPNGKCLKSTT